MQIVWNENSKEAIETLCRLAHDNRVDITIAFTHDEDVEVKVEPTYWDKERSK